MPTGLVAGGDSEIRAGASGALSPGSLLRICCSSRWSAARIHPELLGQGHARMLHHAQRIRMPPER